MIIEGIFSVFAQLLNFVISLFPSFDALVIPADLFATFNYILNLCAWFIPSDVFVVFGAWVAICNFHFIYALIVRIWDALPLT